MTTVTGTPVRGQDIEFEFDLREAIRRGDVDADDVLGEIADDDVLDYVRSNCSDDAVAEMVTDDEGITSAVIDKLVAGDEQRAALVERLMDVTRPPEDPTPENRRLSDAEWELIVNTLQAAAWRSRDLALSMSLPDYALACREHAARLDELREKIAQPA